MSDPSLRILLVEDNPADARLIPELLRMAGARDLEISSVPRLSEATPILARGGIDLILLDLNLPDSTGLETLTRALAAAAQTPVIVLTGLHDERVGMQALQAGAQDYLVKGQVSGELLVRSIRYGLERSAREHEQRETEASEKLLAQAGEELANSLDERTTLCSIARLIVPRLADWCVIDLLDESGEIEVREVIAEKAELEERLREMWTRDPHPRSPDTHPLREAHREGETRLLPMVNDELSRRAAQDPTDLQMLRELAPESGMQMNMVVRGRVLGTLMLGRVDPGRRLTERDLALVGEVGRRAALALENARLYSAACEAQRRAERAAERIQHQEALTAALSAALKPQQVAAALIQHILSTLRAPAGAMYLLREDFAGFDLVRAVGLSRANLERWQRIAWEERNPLSDAARLEEPVIVRADEWEVRYPGLCPLSAAGGPVVVVSLAAGTGCLGALALELSSAGAREDDLAVLLACTRKCAIAMERALLYAREERARSEAEIAARSRDEVLGVVAHDLRNPLASIASYASLLGDVAPDEQRRKYLGAISAATQRMDRLIQDLLDVSSLDAGRFRIEIRSESIQSLLHEATETMQVEAARKNVAVIFSASECVPRIPMDRDRMLQVLGNLLGNAVRFTPSGGQVTLRAETHGREVLFLVTDSGRGIPAEHQPRLFDRFWQAETTKSAGVGLGLTIAKGIVEAHLGRIGVESKPGAGCTFFFALPIDDSDSTDGGPAPALLDETVVDEAPEPQTAPIRVLLVDDHPALRRGLEEQLRRSGGFEVVGTASTGEEALEQTRLRKPDVVLMDLVMPGMGGLEAMRLIRERFPEAKVLAVTAESEGDALLPVLRAGGSGFVRKITAHDDLLPAVRAAARDETFLYASGNQLVLREYMAAAEHDAMLKSLAKHDRDILALAAEGFNSAEIGKRLFLSPKTVDSYRSRAMRKLGLSHRSELVQFALSTGLLTLESGRTTPASR
jgi:DNA-binding NarL/FixJ family response regulator/nitrogen-specific signal transduction histidine kinase